MHCALILKDFAQDNEMQKTPARRARRHLESLVRVVPLVKLLICSNLSNRKEISSEICDSAFNYSK